MAAETTELMDVTFTVNAWGAPAGGKWPHFVLRLDGVEIGQATVASASLGRYTFNARVPADKAHKLQLQYDNDGFVNGEDRNLFVKSFEVNGKPILSIDPLVTYDTGDIDGKNVIAGQTEMYWRGALNVDLPKTMFASAQEPEPEAPATMTTEIVVKAWGAAANGTPPHFKLLVDDKVVGDAWVSATSPTGYTFKVDVDPNEAHKIQIHYDNDATVNGQDRNLFVQGITIDGQEIKSTSPMASYDKGPVDGKFVVAGQEGLFWGGALTFGVPEEYFDGPYVPPPPPPPPAKLTPTDIVVTAWGQSAGGVAPHFKLLVDGKVIGEGRATSSDPQPFSFTVDLDAKEAHRIQIHYDNDSVVNGQDRNLFVKSVSINGNTVAATDSIVTYDKGAVDGKDVVKGQEGLFWGGALNVDAPASLFQPPAEPPPPPPSGPAFYVAANGKDTWSGKLSAPNADGTDGPFASLERARDAMRDSDVDTTYVREGVYRLTKTLELTGADNGHSFRNYPGETPVLNGAEKVTNFVSEGNGIYSAKLSQATDLDLTIGGVRQTLASKGIVDADNPTTTGWYFADAANGGPSGWSVRYHTGDMSSGDIIPGMKIQLMDAERLSDTLTEIAGVNDATRTITLKNGTSLPFAEGTTYKLLNNPSFVDQAGEFAWRASDKALVFKPENPATLAQDGVEVARLGTLIRLTGSSDVTIEGLGFTNTTTWGYAVELKGASGNSIGNNSFLNVGTAIKLTAASSNNLVGGNTLDHLAVNGIELDGRSNGNTVYANDIAHVGEVRKGVAGIIGTGVDNNLIAHNDVDSSARYGISLKNWDSTNINRNNVIEYNRVTNTNLETADGGGIEVLGRSSVDTGTIIRGNWVEHVGGLATSNTDQWLTNHKGFGIYLDDMAGGVTVTGNFLKDTGLAGVHIHGGDNNLVTNNFSIIASNVEEFIRVGWAPKHGDPGLPRNNTITGNLISGTLPLDDYMELLTAGNPVIDRNLVYNVPRYGDNDVTGKPLFNNPYWGDYSLQPNSPALAMGIHDLDWAMIGHSGYTASDSMPHFWDA
ncbi:carbohydrate-binding domain-containing protein [Azospirillum argentinense]